MHPNTVWLIAELRRKYISQGNLADFNIVLRNNLIPASLFLGFKPDPTVITPYLFKYGCAFFESQYRQEVSTLKRTRIDKYSERDLPKINYVLQHELHLTRQAISKQEIDSHKEFLESLLGKRVNFATDVVIPALTRGQAIGLNAQMILAHDAIVAWQDYFSARRQELPDFANLGHLEDVCYADRQAIIEHYPAVVTDAATDYLERSMQP